MSEGFLIGGGLIVAGLLLELSVGPVDWDAFQWPANAIALAVFLLLIGGCFLLHKRVYAFQFLSTYKAAVPALTYAVALTIIMGLTRQQTNGVWLNHMLTFWPFVLIYVYLDFILGLTVLRQLSTWASHRFALPAFRLSLLPHLGLFIALTAATLGSADVQRLKMITVKGQPEWRTLDQHGVVRELGVAIELKEFIMEQYADGKPKRFASEILILTRDNRKIQTTVEVNKPVKASGWKIYQYGYDTQMGPQSNVSILEFVRDPWLPVVYTGIYLLLAGAVCFLLRTIPWRSGWRQTRKHPWRALAITALTLAVFFCVHHFMPILHSDTLVPALQSPWFRPHIIAYMLAYTLMGSAAAMGLYQLVRGSAHDAPPASFSSPRGGREGASTFVTLGLSLITIGMLFGALWAKEAWGHYWSWDPKETWAAITWFAYLVYIHYTLIPNHKPRLALALVLISFALLQMCWWGIRFLPAAQESSVHVYSS